MAGALQHMIQPELITQVTAFFHIYHTHESHNESPHPLLLAREALLLAS